MPLPEQFGTAVLPMCSASTHGAAAPIKAMTRLATSTTLWSYSMYAGGNTSYFRMGDFANATLPRSVCSYRDCNPYTMEPLNKPPCHVRYNVTLGTDGRNDRGRTGERRIRCAPFAPARRRRARCGSARTCAESGRARCRPLGRAGAAARSAGHADSAAGSGRDLAYPGAVGFRYRRTLRQGSATDAL